MLIKEKPLMIISFQGEEGAYSQLASLDFYNKTNKTITTRSCKSFEDALKSVAEKEADYVMIPIENSIAGQVHSAYDAIIKYNLNIYYEVILKIEHCLMIHPQANLEKIKLVLSHPQALAQCKENIKKIKLTSQSFFNTAGAAKYISNNNILHKAVIASKLAAKHYSLKIIKEGFQDQSFNYTRFLLLGNKKETQIDNHTKYKSTIIINENKIPNFSINLLNNMILKNINVIRIESIPLHSKAWHYVFWIDFKGHINSLNIKTLFKTMIQKNMIKILGSYPSIIL